MTAHKAPPVYIIGGHPCIPVIMKFMEVQEEPEMPHGIDDDFDLDSLWKFPLPTDDESKAFADKKREAQSLPPVVNNNVTAPFVATPNKILRTPEMFADEVATFHMSLRSRIPTAMGTQYEMMISVLTQDYLRFLLNQ